MNWRDIEELSKAVGPAVQGASIPILDYHDPAQSIHDHVVFRGVLVVRWVSTNTSSVRLVLRRGKPQFFLQRAEQVRVPKWAAERQPKDVWDAGWRPAGMGRPTGLTQFIPSKQAVELFGIEPILKGFETCVYVAKVRMIERLQEIGTLERKVLDMLRAGALPSDVAQVAAGDANAPEN